MTSRSLAVILASMIACSDGVTAPGTRDMEVTLCNASPSLWIAYHNEVNGWIRLDLSNAIDPGGAITLTLRATDRMAVAKSWVSTMDSEMEILYGSADQVRQLLECATPPVVFSELRGPVQGLSGKFANVSIGPTTTFIAATAPEFRLFNVPGTARDLIASRFIDAAEGMYADRIIMRRNVPYPEGQVALLDFESTEAFAPETSTLSWTGERATVRTDFLGADGSYHILGTLNGGGVGGPIAERTATMYSVPANRLDAGARHGVHLMGDGRGAFQAYRDPGNLTMTFGPALATPTFEELASAPNLRIRATLPSQPEYNGYVVMGFSQSQQDAQTLITITMTREYRGEDATAWSVAVPDLAGVPGFTTGMGLDATRPYQWGVTVRSNPWTLRGYTVDLPPIGEEVRWAGSTGSSQ